MNGANPLERLIRKTISSCVAAAGHSADTGWLEPLVAFARADDPLFKKLKDLVDKDHALPHDLLPGARSVIAYFIPFNHRVAESNIPGRYCSPAWATAYVETNRLIGLINRRLEEALVEKGCRAGFAPATHNFDPLTLRSSWSHRSAAFITGLGTFGLNRMLITTKGCCGRIGTLVTDLKLPPTPRPETENCLYKAGGGCTDCLDRCVNKALTIDGLDKQSCYKMLLTNGNYLADSDNTADVCGKCLVDIPCSFKIPGDHG